MAQPKYSALHNAIRICFFIACCCFNSPLFSQDLSNLSTTKPFTASGTVGASFTSYSANEIENRQQPFTWMINGNINALLYGVNVPISFILTEQQRSYTQPFNQFGLSPTYKWATLHLGYRAMQFSPFTLAGNTFLGAGVELKPKNFRIAAMTGRFLKAVEEDATNNYVTPSYKRTGKAVKVGYGTVTNFIDLIYLKAEDDTASLKKKPEQFIINPSENTVIGFSGKKSFKKKVFLEADYAISKFKKNLFVDSNTVNRYALKTSAAYQLKNINFKVQFKRIEPEYKSLGAAYITADVQEITFAPSFVLLQKKLRIATSIGTQKDNLNNQKFATTNRLIASAVASYAPNAKYGLDVNYMNYSTGQESGRINLNDSVKLSQTLSNFTVTNRYTWMRTQAIHNFILVLSLQKLNDQNRLTEQFTENNTRVANLSYVFTPTKIPFSFTVTYMNTFTQIASTEIKNSGVTIGASRNLQNGKINLNASVSYLKNKMDGHDNGSIINAMLGVNYSPHKKHAFNANVNYFDNSTKETGAISFSELRAMIGYEFSF